MKFLKNCTLYVVKQQLLLFSPAFKCVGFLSGGDAFMVLDDSNVGITQILTSLGIFDIYTGDDLASRLCGVLQ